MATNGNTLRLQANVPEIIALQYAEGREVESQFGGAQVMYSLCDGRRAYFPTFVAERIEALGIGPNQPFEICKREVRKGTKTTVKYEVNTPTTESAVGQTAPSFITQSSSSTTGMPNDTRPADGSLTPEELERLNGFRAERGLPPYTAGSYTGGKPVTVLPLPKPAANGNGNSRALEIAAQLAAELQGQPLPARSTTVAESLAVRTGKEAIDAILAVEGYAQSRGYTDFSFSPDNIWACWGTMLIQALKGGAR